MNNQDIRWKQRFENFEKSFELLEQPINQQELSVLERGGFIKFYEMAFELSWKVMKDYLTLMGYSVASPRQAIKQAFQQGLIENGHQWLIALDDRNITVHTYDLDKALNVEQEIRMTYYPLLQAFYLRMKQEFTSG